MPTQNFVPRGYTMTKQPESMDECVYFTRRALGEKGHATAWVMRQTCSSCKKALMGKPVVKGKIKIRAPIYVCPACGHEETKEVHEEGLTADIDYTCPECNHTGHATTPYKRKKLQGVESFVFNCESCDTTLGVSKKMKKPKKKKKK